MVMLLFLIQSTFALELRNLSIDYIRMIGGGRYLESPHEQIKDRMGVDIDFQLIGPTYIGTRVHGFTTPDRFSWAALKFEAGVNVGSNLDVFFYHHSQHGLDRPHPIVDFPVEDGVGIRIRLK